MAANRKRLTHLDRGGRARMVDVGAKAPTRREAVAAARVLMRPETLRLIVDGALPKGDVLAVARVAGIAAAKETPRLIPLCHPLLLTHVGVEFALETESACVRCTVQAETLGRTGVEMEALTAVQVGLLTIYDMVKAVDRGMVIEEVRLLEKQGGRSGAWRAGEA